MDQAKFLGSDFINDVFKSLTDKVGDLEVDYGDAHFRRANGGNEMYNPFVENYIMDEFETEFRGAEFYWHYPSGFLRHGRGERAVIRPLRQQPLSIRSPRTPIATIRLTTSSSDR